MTSAWQRLSELGDKLRCRGDVMTRQETWLRACMEHNRATDYGQQHGFGQIRSAEEFRERVPLVTYEDLIPRIERVASGEADVLFKGISIAFERTGGSTGGNKLIPYSKASLLDFRSAILPWLADATVAYGLASGCAYWAISPATRSPEQTRGGTPVGLPDGAYLGNEALPAFADLSAVPPWLGGIASVHDWQLATLYWLIRRNDLELISVWSPTFFLALLDRLEQPVGELKTLLHLGGRIIGQVLPPDVSALRRLNEYIRSKDARSLWPSLKLVSCWADASSKPFFNELRKRLPHAAFQGKGLLATEGVVTVPNQEGHPVLAADSGFFEFFGQDGRSRFAHELLSGERYEVVMTTSGGLYRYRTGDCVACEGFTNTLPVLRFMGRNGLVSDMVGEKLTEEFVTDCLKDIGGFRMLLPCVRGRPKYVLVVDERSEIKPGLIAASIEACLSRNPQYAYARRMGQLDELSIVLVAHPWESYQRRAVERGARIGDVKAPSLSPEKDWLETFLEAAL